jgi:isopentenyldiphosphate isomerase
VHLEFSDAVILAADELQVSGRASSKSTYSAVFLSQTAGHGTQQAHLYKQDDVRELRIQEGIDTSQHGRYSGLMRLPRAACRSGEAKVGKA